MTLTKLTACILLATASLAAVAVTSSASAAVLPTNAIVLVDDTPIPRTELISLLERARRSYATQGRPFPAEGTPALKSLRRQAIAYLVQREEYAIKARELGVSVTAGNIDARTAAIVRKHFKNNWNTFRSQLREQGYTMATFRVDVRAQLVSERLYNQVTKGVAASRKEAVIRQWAESVKQEFEGRVFYRTGYAP